MVGWLRLNGYLLPLLLGLLYLEACSCGLSKNSIKVDGSGTVFVLSEGIAEEYRKQRQGYISIGISGTGGGFKKLCSKRSFIIGASRTITDQEKLLCQINGVEFMEFPIANDGIVVVVNKENSWLNQIAVSTLKKIFEPEAEGKILHWNDVNQKWPDREFEIFAPGIASGTYDYFTKEIVGKAHSSRGDLTSSEDDNVLVHGIRSTQDSIGFLSFAYYLENKGSLKALAIIDDRPGGKNQPIIPSPSTIENGEYVPLSRQIFLYTNKVLKPKEENFLTFYLENCAKIASDVGFISLGQGVHKHILETFFKGLVKHAEADF